MRIFVLHHHLLPVPGTGRERNIVYDAGDVIECLQRSGVNLVLSGHKHVPYAWRLENLFVVSTGTVSCLRLRGATRPCYNVIEVDGHATSSIWRRYPFHGQERIIQFDLATLEYEKYTGRIEREVIAAAVKAVALIDGEHYPDVVREALAGAAVRVGRRDPRRRDARSCAARPTTACRCWTDFGDAEVVVDLSDEPVLGPDDRFRWASQALAAGLAYVGADFRFDPPAYADVRAAVDRRDRHRQARREDRASRRTSPRCSPAIATWSSSRWAAAARPSPR